MLSLCERWDELIASHQVLKRGETRTQRGVQELKQTTLPLSSSSSSSSSKYLWESEQQQP